MTPQYEYMYSKGRDLVSHYFTTGKAGIVHFNLCLHSGDLFTQVPGCSQWCGGSTGPKRGNTSEERHGERAHSKTEWQIGESVYVHAVDTGMHLARGVIAGYSGINPHLSGALASDRTIPICLVHTITCFKELHFHHDSFFIEIKRSSV